MSFKAIKYEELNTRQKENYNFQKVSGVFADFGFKTILLSDDWNGADFLAVHINGEVILKILLKGRLTFAKKYFGKDLHVCFRDNQDWFVYPHDELFDKLPSEDRITNTKSWGEEGACTFPVLSATDRLALGP